MQYKSVSQEEDNDENLEKLKSSFVNVEIKNEEKKNEKIEENEEFIETEDTTTESSKTKDWSRDSFLYSEDLDDDDETEIEDHPEIVNIMRKHVNVSFLEIQEIETTKKE
eukprot:gene118-4364_t